MNRNKRQQRRKHITFALRIGQNKLHMSVGLNTAGRPIELWLDMHKQGSAMRGLADAIARLVSRGLQYGVPVEEVIDQFVGTKFECAMASGHPAIEGRVCSLLDAVGRVLDVEFNGGAYSKEFDHGKPQGS